MDSNNIKNKTMADAKHSAIQSNTIEVNGVKIHYLLAGDPEGSPVLLWHGFLGTSSSWKKVISFLTASGFSVLAPDMRGYGDSVKPAGIAGYDARSMSEDFRALVKLSLTMGIQILN
ncbi:hypothetical protein CTE07_49720 [Chitinophaga terrae (ex Kim and Jung 2007)]|nr:hypothetical protein CTE07_49720 [Chitinophaga terrae (ex Kim and Jung 2007)]